MAPRIISLPLPSSCDRSRQSARTIAGRLRNTRKETPFACTFALGLGMVHEKILRSKEALMGDRYLEKMKAFIRTPARSRSGWKTCYAGSKRTFPRLKSFRSQEDLGRLDGSIWWLDAGDLWNSSMFAILRLGLKQCSFGTAMRFCRGLEIT